MTTEMIDALFVRVLWALFFCVLGAQAGHWMFG